MSDSEAKDDFYSLVNRGRGGRLLNVQEYYTEPGERKNDGNIQLLTGSWKHKLVWGLSWYCAVGVEEETKKYY